MKTDPAKLQHDLGYEFRDPKLLTEALMHRSFAMENNLKFDNQRLEFLGDAVLQIILTDELYRRYPEYAEGMLTKIRSAMANQDSLARLARKINLGDSLMLGHGEIECGGASRDSTLSDAFEALLGAIYLDSGMVPVQTLALQILREEYPDPENLLRSLNPKGTLQEFCQHHFGKPPFYKTLSVAGEDHNPVFTVQVSVGETVLAVAEASKRKHAESAAADLAIENIRAGKFDSLKKNSSAGKPEAALDGTVEKGTGK